MALTLIIVRAASIALTHILFPATPTESASNCPDDIPFLRRESSRIGNFKYRRHGRYILLATITLDEAEGDMI